MQVGSKNRTSWVFLEFLKLGCSSFGGPVAHLAYFRRAFVQNRALISEEAYADLIALCQCLPGPTSSQVGFAIGKRLAGLPGAWAAWCGFTLPSTLLMMAFAAGLNLIDPGKTEWITGLKLAVFAVILHALTHMAARLCPDPARALMAITTALILSQSEHGAILQLPTLAAAAMAGWLIWGWKKPIQPPATAIQARSNTNHAPLFLAAGLSLLLLLPLLAPNHEAWRIFNSSYQTGFLVFGGGHVVLPLLQSTWVGNGWISQESFFAGYGAAQALPGPLFAFNAYLGMQLHTPYPGGVAGAMIALIGVFLPSWLLLLGCLPLWDYLKQARAFQACIKGINAAVVGLLASPLLQTETLRSLTNPQAILLILLAFSALQWTKIPPWAVVICCAIASNYG
jgi:chromate transporter